MKKISAFTLIELLIVVAIIAILASIAVPNFLEAQIRAKVARVKSDLRVISSGVELYMVDNSTYPPNDGDYNVIPICLSTPISYLGTTELIDPFKVYQSDDEHGELVQYYTYMHILKFRNLGNLFQWQAKGNPAPPWVAVDVSGGNLGALKRYGKYRMSSNGPDGRFDTDNMVEGPFNPNPAILKGCDIPYDSSNGTISPGSILRTQAHTDGAKAGDSK